MNPVISPGGLSTTEFEPAATPGFKPAHDWADSLDRYREAFHFTTKALHPEDMDRTRDIFNACSGVLIFTGIGQNGSLAQKISMTYNSLSIRSICLDATAALHGTMGLLRKEDIVIPLSRSGNTSELIVFLQACRRVGFDRILAVHGNPQSEMVRLSKWNLEIPVPYEADHLNLAPTVSSVCFLAVLQAIAVNIASLRGLTHEEFVKTHPGGTLGKEPVVHAA
jgi:arabinose-5-phosphate isomerase